MRITNIEKFRNELYEAIRDTCEWTIDTPSAIFKSDFKMVDGNVRVVSLARPMKIKNGELYITVDEDAVCFWRSENGYFEFDGYIKFELYRNKMSFIAALVLRIKDKLEK